MTQPSTEERIETLLSPERRDRLDALQIFSVLPLRPYTTVADVGCGPGLLTIPLAKAVWDGHVYAIDVDNNLYLVDGDRLRIDPQSLVEIILVTHPVNPSSFAASATSIGSALLHNPVSFNARAMSSAFHPSVEYGLR